MDKVEEWGGRGVVKEKESERERDIRVEGMN